MTSVSESTFAPPSSNAHSQLNGDVPISPNGELNNSASMENISSIHNNIFFKAFGKPAKYPSVSSSKPTTNLEERIRRDHLTHSSSVDNDDSSEDIEYRPVSGFVHRLRGRFSGVDSKGDRSSKRSSSLEDVFTDGEASKKSVNAEEPTLRNIQKQNVLSSALSSRARSIESLDAPLRKQHPLAIPLRHVETKQEKEKQLKSPRDSHVIAPDVDLANDDIIIIESTPPVPSLQLLDHNDNSDNEPPQVHSYREEILPEELPKPNTVLNVRSLFETASTVSVASSLVHRRRRSDSSEITPEKTQGSLSQENNVSNRTSFSSPLSPRITPNDAAPIKSESSTKSPSQRNSGVEYLYGPPADDGRKSSTSTSPSFASHRNSGVAYLYGPPPDDGKKSSDSITSTLASTAAPLPTSYSKPASSRESPPLDYTDSSSTQSSARSDSSNNQNASSAEPKSQSILERGSIFDSRHSPSPRSTASVKPTITSSKSQTPPGSMKPMPLSAPASAATSYKWSSPVVPVAPFKTREDDVDDGTPVLIYQKPLRKPERQHINRLQINGKEVNNTENDLIISNDSKSVFEKDKEINNKFVPPRKNITDAIEFNASDNGSKSKDSIENNKEHVKDAELLEASNDRNNRTIPPHTSTISVTKDKTVINLSRTNNDNTQDVKKTKNFAPDVPIPTPQPRTRIPESVKSRPAPRPPMKVEVDESKEEKKKGSMIYISSSDSSESDSSSPPETPRTRPPPMSISEPKEELAPQTEPAISIPAQESTPCTKLSPVVPEPAKERTPLITPSVIPTPEKETTPHIEPTLEPTKEWTPRITPSVTSEPDDEIFRRPKPTPVFPEPAKEWTPRITPTVVPEPEKEETNEKPIRGIPSIIANRLNKQNNSPRDISNSVIEGTNSPSGRDSPDIKLRKTSGSPTKNEDDSSKRDSVSNDIEMQIANMRKKVDNSRSKGGGGATQIFDSSQLAKKRKERKEAAAKAAAAAATSSQGIVPPLDFSGLNDNNRNMTPAHLRRKEIKPCNIKFIGENAPTSRNLLKKQRKVKINIRFKDDLSDTFEYPSEDTAIQAYREQHPDEPEEAEDDILFLGGSSGLGESSDDVDEEEVATPREGRKEEEEGLKSNPALSSTSTLQSYRGRFQEEFVFGSHRQEPEPVVSKPEADQVDDPESMMLRPAEEEYVDTWSTNNSSDLLF